jgi:hypothetical protein
MADREGFECCQVPFFLAERFKSARFCWGLARGERLNFGFGTDLAQSIAFKAPWKLDYLSHFEHF